MRGGALPAHDILLANLSAQATKAKAANFDVRVLASGFPSIHASVRCTGYLAHPVRHLMGHSTTEYRQGLERDS